MLCVIEGIDGAGKSTLCRILAEDRGGRAAPGICISRNRVPDSSPSVVRQLKPIAEVLWPAAEEEEETDLLGTHFYLFLLSAWFSALSQTVLRACQERPERVYFIDGYYYRVMVKARLRAGLDEAWLRSLFAHVPKPDLVLLLDIKPELAFRRRVRFKPTELGRWDDVGSDRLTAFCTYQERVRQALLVMAQEEGWCVLRQEDTTTPEDLATEVMKELRSRVGPDIAGDPAR